MNTRWLAILALLLSIALITACDTKQTAVVSLEEQKHDGKSWNYTMEPADLLIPKEVRVAEKDSAAADLHQWQFMSKKPGKVKLCFRYGDEADAPYMNYEYRIEKDKTITVVGISGTALPGACSN